MLTDTAEKIFKLKYAITPEETWEQASWRVASFIAKDNLETAKIYYNLIVNQYFIPGGRILANAGTGISNLLNCFFFNIEDSRKDIYDKLKTAAEVFALGGGCGYNFSDIRETGSNIKMTGGRASGPLSFMTLFDQTGEVIQQASRRGAQIALLNCDHPDIEHFIDFKSIPNSRNERLLDEYDRNLKYVDGRLKNTKYYDVLRKTLLDDQLTHFNMSVGILDKFMIAVTTDSPWKFNNRGTGLESKVVDAKELLMKMAKHCWESGDPGVFFIDRANEDNLVPYIDSIRGTNPCFHPDTLIETIHGRVKIKDLTYPELVYTMSYSGNLGLAKTNGAFITKHRVPTVIVKLSDGKKIIVTPDHQLYTKDKGYVEAKDLLVGQELVVLNRTRRGSRYAGIKLSINSNYQMEHRFLYENVYGKIPDGYDIHHVDGDSYNNNIDNLVCISQVDHAKITTYSNGKGTSSHTNNRPLPKELKTGYKETATVVYIKKGPITDVYDLQVENTYNVVANYIVAHNCGEVPLTNGEPCDLGSINLYKFIHNNTIDFQGLEEVVRYATRFLDGVHDVTKTGIELVDYKARGLRRIGLGVMGFADVLAELEIPYDSADAKNLAKYLSWFISFFSIQESIELAKEKGTFSLYDSTKVDLHIVDKVLNSEFVPYKFNMDTIREIGLRNVSVTSLAPTGSIALLVNVNSTIEPYFALAYKRNITEGVGNKASDSIIEINPILFRKLEKYGLTEDEITKVKLHVYKTGSVQDCELVPEKLKAVFKTANEIHWKDHIDIQAHWQQFITNAVSKTINCPEDTTPEEIFDMYLYAWNSELKGITIYRNNSRMFQILNKGTS